MEKHIQISEKNIKKAWEIIEKVKIREIWQSIGAEINLVGSLSMGLMNKHRDIDFHIYTPELSISQSFLAMTKLAEQPGIRKIDFTNFLDEQDQCLEWHAWYEDEDKNLWQFDMIHIIKGSTYDGYFEKVAQQIKKIVTSEQKDTILRLKYETPENEKIMGVEYYQAVIRDGVKTYADLEQWRITNTSRGIVEWMPEE